MVGWSERLTRRVGRVWPLQLLGVGVGATLFIAWCGWFIWRTSFVVEGERYFSLFDDAMISMAYARNLVEGYGLNWAREGAPVEGLTNPLWTAAMVAFNATGLPLRYRALGVQVLAVVVLLLLLWNVARLCLEHFCGEGRSGGPSRWGVAVVLSATFYPLLYWTLMGMEVGLQALLLVVGVRLALDVGLLGRPREAGLMTVLALGCLVRMDFAIAVLVIGSWLIWNRDGEQTGLTWNRRWLVGLCSFALLVGGYQVFRLLYFGDWLPNTYYLKLSGIPLELRLTRGLMKLVDSLRASSVALAFLAAFSLPAFRRARAAALPAGLALSYAAYSVWVGGDAWEMHNNMRANRFLAAVAPLMFIVLNDGLLRVLSILEPRAKELRLALLGGAAILVSFGLNGLWFSPDSERNWRTVAVVDRPLLVTSHAGVLQDLERFKKVVAPGARVATHWAGIPAFFSDYRLIDAMGYSDRHIARRPVPASLRPEDYTPGHNKNDAEYVLAQHPDALFQAWNLPTSQPRRYLRKKGYHLCAGFWVLPQSSFVGDCDPDQG